MTSDAGFSLMIGMIVSAAILSPTCSPSDDSKKRHVYVECMKTDRTFEECERFVEAAP
jgi:hypothetical protein